MEEKFAYLAHPARPWPDDTHHRCVHQTMIDRLTASLAVLTTEDDPVDISDGKDSEYMREESESSIPSTSASSRNED
jgi:hypothetical protein